MAEFFGRIGEVKASYRGRFAPSPTGPLHFGSLVAAVASYADARAAAGEWLVRIEDVDTPRSQPGAADGILTCLERFGLTWDGPVLWQSRRSAAYREALDRLRASGLVYPCGCSRKEIADSQNDDANSGAVRYPGTCAHGLAPGKQPRAWRFRVPAGIVCLDDRLQGRRCLDVAASAGDFILLRADGWFAYQLAVVVDDAAQGITDIVRGADLLEATPRQIVLQRALGAPLPRYLHIPVVTGPDGGKLSKQTGAAPLDPCHAAAQLCDALAFLGHPPPPELRRGSPNDVLQWAVPAWDPAAIPPAASQPRP